MAQTVKQQRGLMSFKEQLEYLESHQKHFKQRPWDPRPVVLRPRWGSRVLPQPTR